MEPLPFDPAPHGHTPPEREPPLRVREALVHWAVGLAAWIGPLLASVRWQWNITGVLVAVYLLVGFWLNRRVLRRLVDWHPNHDTVHNVSSSKLWTWLFWPVSYPVLMFKLVVVKVL